MEWWKILVPPPFELERWDEAAVQSPRILLQQMLLVYGRCILANSPFDRLTRTGSRLLDPHESRGGHGVVLTHTPRNVFHMPEFTQCFCCAALLLNCWAYQWQCWLASFATNDVANGLRSRRMSRVLQRISSRWAKKGSPGRRWWKFPSYWFLPAWRQFPRETLLRMKSLENLRWVIFSLSTRWIAQYPLQSVQAVIS